MPTMTYDGYFVSRLNLKHFLNADEWVQGFMTEINTDCEARELSLTKSRFFAFEP